MCSVGTFSAVCIYKIPSVLAYIHLLELGGWGGDVCCACLPSSSSVLRNEIGKNIFMLKQQNTKGSNFLFTQTSSGLLGLNFLKTELGAILFWSLLVVTLVTLHLKSELSPVLSCNC